MARSFLTAINLNKNELQNAAIQNLGSAPASPVKGQLYYNSTGGDDTLYWWNGTTWVPAKAGGAASFGTITAETTFGTGKNDGVATTYARSDHQHGNPTHTAADHSTIPVSSFAPATGDVNMNAFRITGLNTPVAPTDAANKQYVDNSIAGLSWKDSVRVASTANQSPTGLPTIDGVTVVAGDRVLLKNNTAQSTNGIYTAAAGAWQRAFDADTPAELVGASVFVEAGTTNADTAWVLTNNAPIDLGNDPLTWAQFAGGGTVTAGAGMTQSGNVLNVIAADASIIVNADNISRGGIVGDVAIPAGSVTATLQSGVVNSTHIVDNSVNNFKLADMPANTFKGNNSGATGDPADLTAAQMKTALGIPALPVTVPNGGTGTPVLGGGLGYNLLLSGSVPGTDPMDSVPNQGTLGNALFSNGSGAKPGWRTIQIADVSGGVRKFAAAVAAATSTVINHAFGTKDVLVEVYRVASPFDVVDCDIELTDTNNVTVRFAVAPAAGDYRVVVVG